MTSCASYLPNAAGLVDGGVDGETLQAVMQTGPIALSRLLEIAVQAAENLAVIHQAGAVHGKLTAADILLARDGGLGILNLGVFRAGSPQDDQLALGRILSAALEATEVNLDPRATLPGHWVIDRLLAEKPEDRYASTRDLHLDLRAIRTRLPEMEALLSQPEKKETRAPARDRRPLIAIPLTLLVCSVFMFYLLSHSGLPKRGQAEIRSFPVWSADGKKILFVKSVGGVDQVFVQAFDSAIPVQLTHASRASFNPRWSSDGRGIAFQRMGRWWTGPLGPDQQKPE
jgi:hypothetical protein